MSISDNVRYYLVSLFVRFLIFRLIYVFDHVAWSWCQPPLKYFYPHLPLPLKDLPLIRNIMYIMCPSPFSTLDFSKYVSHVAVMLWYYTWKHSEIYCHKYTCHYILKLYKSNPVKPNLDLHCINDKNHNDSK